MTIETGDYLVSENIMYKVLSINPFSVDVLNCKTGEEQRVAWRVERMMESYLWQKAKPSQIKKYLESLTIPTITIRTNSGKEYTFNRDSKDVVVGWGVCTSYVFGDNLMDVLSEWKSGRDHVITIKEGKRVVNVKLLSIESIIY